MTKAVRVFMRRPPNLLPSVSSDRLLPPASIRRINDDAEKLDS